jgi:hypothetical protein
MRVLLIAPLLADPVRTVRTTRRALAIVPAAQVPKRCGCWSPWARRVPRRAS